MSEFEKFSFKDLDALKEKIDSLSINLKLSDDLAPLKQPVKIGHLKAPNAMAILPMEGCDGNLDGSPSEFVYRRYRRFAAGGAGLLWFEACAVTEEGRANPLQLFLTSDNVKEYRKLVAEVHNIAIEANGADPVCILQLTHSGRYARPIDKAAPLIAQHDPLLDPSVGVKEGDPVVTDEYLDALQDKYVQAALLAKQAGFDGVDIKACHRYLVSELLASHTRQGKYGGSFENRSRFLLETIRKVKAAAGEDFIVACRFNVFDAHPYPYGFGVSKEDAFTWDETEPMRLVRMLVEAGASLLSNSGGNPYYRFPQVTRPFDLPAIDGEIPKEHPLESVARLFAFTRAIQKAAGKIPVVGNGYSWLRQFLPYAGAANLADGSASFVGIGREAFAYPDAPNDILKNNEMKAEKCCITCSKCTQIMRDHGKTGCVIRDSEIYLQLYRQYREEAKNRINSIEKAAKGRSEEQIGRWMES